MTGTFGLLRLVLRRDRVVMPLWVLLLGILPYVYLTGFEKLFATAPERIHYARVGAANAGFIGLYGPLRGDSLGELAVWRGGFLPVMIGLAALLTVVRHTRADEEAGRTELVRAGVVGRFAPLAAAVLAAVLACTVVGVIVAVTLIGRGQPAAGSIALAVSYAFGGWLFAGVAAVTAQIGGSGRQARALAVLVLGLSYLLRLAGDISALGGGRLDWMSWLSPIGWVHRVFPFGADDWWPLVPVVSFAFATVGASAYLLTRRDLGGGLLASRLGPATAAASLRSPLALAWRLHRGLLAGWTAGFAALGLVFGGVSRSVAQLVEESSSMGRIFSQIGGTGSALDAYFASIAQTSALIISCYAVQAALRIRDEEQTGHAEAVLSTDVSRRAWAASHLVFALFGPAVALLAEGTVAGITHGDPGPVVVSALAQLPAVWVLAGATVLLIGTVPKLAAAAWAVVVTAFLILIVGPLVQADQWLLDLSPFAHVPHLPGPGFTVVPLLLLTLIAAGLSGAGLIALRHRDLPV